MWRQEDKSLIAVQVRSGEGPHQGCSDGGSEVSADMGVLRTANRQCGDQLDMGGEGGKVKNELDFQLG